MQKENCSSQADKTEKRSINLGDLYVTIS